MCAASLSSLHQRSSVGQTPSLNPPKNRTLPPRRNSFTGQLLGQTPRVGCICMASVSTLLEVSRKSQQSRHRKLLKHYSPRGLYLPPSGVYSAEFS